jgi:hypothetical protein
MITGLMASLHGISQLLPASGPSGGDGFPNLIVQWTKVVALCVHSYDMRKVTRSRCNLPDFAIEPILLALFASNDSERD